ncbi:MAG: hypothetical protein EOM50_11330 [Erysipelotrichia bacterium]|nr:hypothetical protein [Erysipelotrichia bacterium]NCC55151.1 hypothetical protein [Erysipelotrichia bacterium]
MLRVSQIKLSLEENEDCLHEKIISKLKLPKKSKLHYHIHRRNIDARDKSMIYFVYSVNVVLTKELEKSILRKHLKDVSKVASTATYTLKKGCQFMQHRPIIVGFGPAGMFAAYTLSKYGYRPIVFERGEDVDARSKSVETFFRKGILNEESNIQFGEGGAGTFSDGKLTARSKDIRVQMIYDTFVSFGAPKDIAFESLPHIGSDRLKEVIKKMREEIIALGGEVHFSSKVEQLVLEHNEIQGVIVDGKSYPSNHVILALGNSARDTIRTFHKQGLLMESKAFAIGVRVEQKQALINQACYHQFANHSSLSAASYFLSNQKGTYTFCMCPGGMVVAATSLKEHVVVNGMSNRARDGSNANSAILVQVDSSLYGDNLFDGMDFIDELERKAYLLGGANYQAPAQRVVDFLKRTPSKSLANLKPSYPLNVRLCSLDELLPATICEQMRNALYDFDHKIKGFINEDALLTAVETRSSSPIRILRDKEKMMSINIKGVYPCGEGAGYAGGIISSAIDGVKCAEKIISEFIYMEEEK